jgi:hypothetical protein
MSGLLTHPEMTWRRPRWLAALEGFEPVCVDFEPVCWHHLQANKSRQHQSSGAISTWARWVRYPYEVRDAKDYFSDIPALPIAADMLELAERILDSKARRLRPGKFPRSLRRSPHRTPQGPSGWRRPAAQRSTPGAAPGDQSHGGAAPEHRARPETRNHAQAIAGAETGVSAMRASRASALARF